MKRFYVGLHQPSDCRHFEHCFVSVNRLRPRRRFAVQKWVLDSGAFTELHTYGTYRHSVAEYAAEANRLSPNGDLHAVVSQDFMCEPFILAKTGLSVDEHQRLTIERYDALCPLVAAYVMPVLQGYDAAEYVRHVRDYGERLTPGMWVGVGSVCKRQGDPALIANVLGAIKAERPDLLLHGFGVKLTAFNNAAVCRDLHTADSMAWSYSARKQGRSPNDWHEAQSFAQKITARTGAAS